MKTLILNDLHIGVQRAGGTTVQSQAELREFAQKNLHELLKKAVHHAARRVIFNGDLTDQFDIPLSDALDILAEMREFMDCFPDVEVVWAEGNHDLAKDDSKMGTVQFLGMVLQQLYPGRFTLVERPAAFDGGVYIIPHLANQNLFDEALAAVPEGTQYLLLHCNFDNRFAGAMDHSLNISREQAKTLTKSGITLILGHEHQGRELMAGKVVIVGNQFPTSIADCLATTDGQRDGTKRCMLLNGDGTHEFIRTWSPEQEPDGWYAQVDWRELRTTTESGRGFIRVTGTATALEAADVIKEISWFRQRSKSYVITNAVKVEKPEGFDDLPDTIEDLQQVNVMELLYGMLETEQVAKIKELRGE